MKGEVFYDRIIAGELKGRTVMLPKTGDVRPTKNRVRQAVFNLLTARLDWDALVVADLFCGSGAWGLEALSRGARKIYFVDMDERVAAENIQRLGVKGTEVFGADVRTWRPPALPGVFVDVVLADPPYGKGLAQALVNRVKEMGGRTGTWWCVETGSTEMLLWDGFEAVDYRDYGSSRIWVARQV